jgi:hydroxymethylbilane synthase
MSGVIRVGTRGSDLALRQTRWVCDLLRAAAPGRQVEEVIIATHGDQWPEQPISPVHARGESVTDDWPMGGFVGAIERALLDDRIDFAVHSFKDLPTTPTPGLTIVAVPEREAAHDVLVLREPIALESLPPGFRIGTGSPRRAAQFRRHAQVEIVPIRGNVPTRLMKLEQDGLDGVVLAAAGLKRLAIDPPHRIDLPIDRFVPAPAQGALAIQTRDDASPELVSLLGPLNHELSWRRVEAERSFLATIGPGCHTAAGAYAEIIDDSRSASCMLQLRGQLFSDDESMMAQDVVTGDDPQALGRMLAEQLSDRIRALEARDT